MIRNLLTLVVVAGLVYGAYLVNEKFFTSAPPPGQTKKEEIPASMVSFVCAQDVQAFDPSSPNKMLGYFTKGTEIKVGGESGVAGMKIVAYQPTNGAVIHAICKASDLTDQKNSASTAPLERKKSITAPAPHVTTVLGNGQNSITPRDPGAGTIIKLGQTQAKTKTIGATFGDSTTTVPSTSASPASVAKSPEQGIKDRAKDLQNPQTQ